MRSQRDLLGESDGDGDGEEKDLAEIKVNKSYAQRFAHNKQREALHRLQELKNEGQGGSSSSSSEDEDEDGYIPEKTDLQFYEILTKVKKKDPSIYEKEVKLYDEVDEQEDEKKEKDNKKKALYLKDVMAQHLLEHGPDFADVDENPKKRVTKSYAEEQDELKRAFLMEAGTEDEDDDGGKLLTLKKKSAEELRREKEEEEEAIKEAEQRAKDADVARKLEEYFGGDDGLDENERFLKSYLLNKGWIDRDEGKGLLGYEDVVGVSEDEDEVEKQEKFEAKYNFRFEEGTGDQVLGYARFTEGSIRKKPNARKQQRENKKERLAQAEFERKEELKHLKNIKKKEILEKLEKIRQISGMNDDDGNLLGEEDLEEEFDPEEYDRKMREAFGDEYYGADDADDNFEGYDLDDLEKPDFDAEDELMGLPSGWDGRQSQGFAAARENLKKKKILDHEEPVEDGDSDSSGEEDEENHEKEEEDEENQGLGMDVDDRANEEIGSEGEEGTPMNKKKRKGRISLREKLVFDKQLEEYYKLDYEDMIGDLPTRFKYREVPSNNYGLTAEEVLMTDDKELNQYVSIKKLAPYRTEEWKPLKHHWFSQKKRKRMALQQGGLSSFSNGTKKSKGKSKGEKINVGRLNGHDQIHSKETNGEPDSELKKSKKKRRRKQVPVFAKSRLAAYGMPIRDKKQQKKSDQ